MARYSLADRMATRREDRPSVAIATESPVELQVVAASPEPKATTPSLDLGPEVASDNSETLGAAEWGKLIRDPAMRRIMAEVRESLAEVQGLTSDERDRRLALLAEAQAGDPTAQREIKAMIRKVLQDKRLHIPGKSQDLIVDVVFEEVYGLGILAPLYRDKTVEEIRVNSHDKIFTMRKGLINREPLAFENDDEIRQVVRRILVHDQLDLHREHPRVETTRRDGARVTATTAPFTQYTTLVIRKFDTIILGEETFLKGRSFPLRALRLMKALVKGRVSIIVSGATNVGKTTLLRLLVSFLPKHLRIVTLESDRELNLIKYFPDRDIVAMEEHTELNPPITLAEAFKTVLRMSPHVIIMGEARGGEAEEAVKAALRGHRGSMTTVHVVDAREVVDAVCNMILEERPTRPLQVLRSNVASAYQIVIQLHRWDESGWTMVYEILEQWWDPEQQKVVYNPLMVWKGSEDDPEVGDWEFPNPPSDRLIQRMAKSGVTRKELEREGIVW